MPELTIFNIIALIESFLPSVITIITVITSAIIQVKSAKRETDRIIEQNKHIRDLEKIKEDAARESTMLNKQIEEIQNAYSQALNLYYPMIDALCNITLGHSPKQDCFTIYTHAIKLRSIYASDNFVSGVITELIDYMDRTVLPDAQHANEYFSEMRWRVKSIGDALSNKALIYSISQGTFPPEKLQR